MKFLVRLLKVLLFPSAILYFFTGLIIATVIDIIMLLIAYIITGDIEDAHCQHIHIDFCFNTLDKLNNWLEKKGWK